MQIKLIWLVFSYGSVIGSILLMIMVYVQKQTAPTQLVFYMSLGECLLSAMLAVGASLTLWSDEILDASDAWCGISFFLLHIGINMGALYYFVITLNIHLILRGWTDARLRELRPYQHLGVWMYTLCATLPPTIRHKYAPMSGVDYCYFPEPRDPRRLLMYGPLSIIFCYSMWLILYAIYYFMIRRATLKSTAFAIILRRLSLVVFNFMVLKGPALFVRLIDAILNQKTTSDLQMITLSLSGLANFIVWGITNQRVLNFLSTSWFGDKSEFTEVRSTADVNDTFFATVDETETAFEQHTVTEATPLTNFAGKSVAE